MFNQDVRMEFGVKNVLIMKMEKRETTEEIELPNEETIITLGERENKKYLGILKAGNIKQAEMKKKITLARKNKKISRKQILLLKYLLWNKQTGISPC